MKLTNQVIFLGLLILTACLISLMPFSRTEGYSNTYDAYYQKLNNAAIAADNGKKATGSIATGSKTTGSKTTGNLNAKGSSFNGQSATRKRKEQEILQDEITLLLDELNASNAPKNSRITNNADFMRAVTTALTAKPDTTADTAAIYKLQPQIASIRTKNAQFLLSEMGNPNISYNPRAFLQYMNWYGANCPIDSNACVNVV